MNKDVTEVFLPLSYDEYKENKVTLLKTKIKVVESLERLNRINKLREIKHEQRKLLRSAIREYRKYHLRIKALLPTEKEVKISDKETIQEVIINPKLPLYSNSKLDDELSKIRDKIKNLNL